MTPLVDMHCHLYAGLDDGPRDDEQALAMCRAAVEDGTEWVAAVAHQNSVWNNTPQQILAAAQRLQKQLIDHDVPLKVFPTGEVMLRPDVVSAWQAGEFLSVGGGGRYLLIEFPHGVFIDLTPLVQRLCSVGVRPILAHAERTPQLLYDVGMVERLIQAGCLIQVNADSVVRSPHRGHARALKTWFRCNLVHVLGSDGHSLQHRPPLLSDAYKQIAGWVGRPAADLVCQTHGRLILEQKELQVPPPTRPKRRWFTRFW